MKNVLICWQRSEVVGPDVCQGFTTDEVKAALRNINPAKAAGPEKIHPRFLQHLGPLYMLFTLSFPAFYIVDLASSVGVPQISLFADDVAAWAQVTDLERATSKLQKRHNDEASWSTTWNVVQTAQKSRCSFFTTNTHAARWRPALFLSRQQIKLNPKPKFLGITSDL